MNDIRAFRPEHHTYNMPLVLAYYIADDELPDLPLKLTVTLGYYCKHAGAFFCLHTKAKIAPFAYFPVPKISRDLQERGRRAYKAVD